MSDDVKHLADELGVGTQATQEDDVSTDDATSTDSQSDESSTSYDVESELGKSKEQRKKEAAETQIDVWAKRIKSGEASISDLPADKAWMKEGIEAKLDAKSDKVSTTEDLEDLLDYRENVKLLKESGLKTAELKAIVEKTEAYKARGYKPGEALKEAIAFHKVDLSQRPAPTPIKTGSGVTAKKSIRDYTAAEINLLSPEERGRLILASRTR